MNYKKILLLPFFYITCLLFVSHNGVAQEVNKPVQQKVSPERFEYIYIHWFFAMDKARITKAIPQADFDMFTRFSEKPVDSLRADFMRRIADKEVTDANVGKYESVLINAVNILYEKYENIKKTYPSSVEEFRAYRPSLTTGCDSACNNIDFETGNLSGWNAYYGYNTSSTSAIAISDITGGTAGAVTNAANDILTSNSTYYNPSVGPNQSPDYQIKITSGNLKDAIIPTIPQVSPFGGKYSVMLGDSTQVNYGVAILSQTFLVTPSNTNFTYQYAVFLENPGHNYYQQPFFKVAVLDQNGDTIPYCGDYNVISGHGTQSFDSTLYFDPISSAFFPVYYKNWTIVNVPLKKYLGQCVTIIFESADCGLGGHFGYAYIDASCSPATIISSSPNLCGQDSISLTAPPGGARYLWNGPTGGIRGSDTGQTIWVDSGGKYRVVLIPVTGISCADTLFDSVGRSFGPVPKPNFTVTTPCSGEGTHFVNLSTDTAGGHFYWDFYNIGLYNDTNVVSPTWSYATPGTYAVKLDEIDNGCGSDTLITINIYNPVTGGFTANNGCVGTAVNTTDNTTGATSYQWNYGDPGSGGNNTSSSFNGSHIYNTAGTYTITLIAENGSPCTDTIKQTVIINNYPTPVITGKDSVCPGYSDTLNVTGGTTYAWSTGATTSSIYITAPITQTISVDAFNGVCSNNNNIVVHRVSSNPTITTSRDSVCSGQTATLTAGGGINYRWSTNSTSGNIVVSPTIATTYTLYSTIANCVDSTAITIGMLKPVTLHVNVSADSICQGSSTTLLASGGGGSGLSYSWSTGATTSVITPSPSLNTLYSIQISNGFCTKDTSINIIVKKAPSLAVEVPENITCLDKSVSLNASGAIEYTWAPSTGLNCTNCPNPIANPTTTTTYVVIGSDTDGCTESESVTVTVVTFPVLGAIPNQSVCAGTPITLMANEISGFDGSFTWLPVNSANNIITVSPSTTTTYTVQYSNACGTTSQTVTIFINPAPKASFEATNTQGCAPLCTQFKDLSTISSGSIVQWDWSFGNGDTSTAENPMYCYPDTGVFTPTLTSVADDGCSASLKFVDMITVFSKPAASFIYSPQPTSILEPTIQFNDKSKDHYGIASLNWTFGDATDSTSQLENPEHSYQDTGVYCPQLIVVNNKGCIDTATNCLLIDPIFTLYIPNAFSPNGNGVNDVFIPKGSYIKSFEMYIFDRWGLELYHTTDIEKGWDGKFNGGMSQEDAYVYLITAYDTRNNKHSYIGNVTLLK